ncbi:hypothetical protein NG876_14520, partial [Enterococcus faecium]|uniref:hypothetical protein n=2 Tax=Enterococcus TaxID=1350 RepID=UPI002091CEC7
TLIYLVYSIYETILFSNQVVSVLVLISNVLLVLWFRKNVLGIIISSSLLYFNYSILIFNYFSYSDSMFWGYNGTPVATESLYIILLFITTFIIGIIILSRNNSSISGDLIDWEKSVYNPYLCIIFIFVLIFIFVFGFSRGDLGERGTPSAVYEYSVILFILMAYFSDGSIFFKRVNITLMLMFAGQNLIFAGRVTALQIFITLYLLYFRRKISTKNLMIIAITFFLIFSILGAARGSLFSGAVNINEIINEIKERKFSLDTAYAAFFTAETFIDYRNYVDHSFRINQFFRFFISMFAGGGAIENSNLSVLTHSFRTHYFGGVLPFYFFFWFGSFGVCLSSFIVLIYSQLIGIMKRNDLVKIISI